MLLFALTALATLDKANDGNNEGAWSPGAIAGTAAAVVAIFFFLGFCIWTNECHRSARPFPVIKSDRFFVAEDSARSEGAVEGGGA